MTIHRAKGLEWPVVVLPAVCERRFPSAKPSPRWPTRADTVPTELRDDRAVLPRLSDMGPKSLETYRGACQQYDRTGEDRLAYVAVTRARDVLIASGHWWGPGARMRGPSPYLLAMRSHAKDAAGAGHGAGDRRRTVPDAPWAEPPRPNQDGCAPQNPLLATAQEAPWPAPGRPGPGPLARTRAAAGDSAVGGAGPSPAEQRGPGATDADLLGALDADIEVLLAQLRSNADRPSHPIPNHLSATEVMSVLRDPVRAGADLFRPMPRRPSPAADLGTRFHAWVAGRLGQQLLIPDDELAGAADALVPDRALQALQESFEALDYAHVCPVALEEPFVLQVGSKLVRGRIDAVFPLPAGSPWKWEVVDWKTSGAQRCDPIQLALYRLAWARIRGVPVDDVIASFVDITSGLVVRPDLPDAAELARQLDNSGSAGGAPSTQG
jgi:DNA helicase-2/ATP-dependent DNA helicase PcrA